MSRDYSVEAAAAVESVQVLDKIDAKIFRVIQDSLRAFMLGEEGVGEDEKVLIGIQYLMSDSTEESASSRSVMTALFLKAICSAIVASSSEDTNAKYMKAVRSAVVSSRQDAGQLLGDFLLAETGHFRDILASVLNECQASEGSPFELDTVARVIRNLFYTEDLYIGFTPESLHAQFLQDHAADAQLIFPDGLSDGLLFNNESGVFVEVFKAFFQTFCRHHPDLKNIFQYLIGVKSTRELTHFVRTGSEVDIKAYFRLHPESIHQRVATGSVDQPYTTCFLEAVSAKRESVLLLLLDIAEKLPRDDFLGADYALHQVARLGMGVVIRKYHKLGIFIKESGPMKCSLLHSAALAGNKELVEWLARDLDPLMTDRQGNGSLHYAALSGDVETIHYLLSYTFGIDTYNDAGNAPLAHAVLKGHKEAVTFLLGQGAGVNKSLTPVLLYAINSGKPDLLSYLIEQGADINTCICGEGGLLIGDDEVPAGTSPLMYALLSNQPEMACMLLKETAINLYSRNIHGDSALSLAASKRMFSEVELNILHLKNIQSSCSLVIKETRLLQAVRDEKLDLLEALLSEPSVYLNDGQFGQPTALSAAVKQGNPCFVRRLLRVPDININGMTGKSGSTVLMDAIEYASDQSCPLPQRAKAENIVDQLIKFSGVDLNKRDFMGRNALVVALEGKNYRIAESLLRIGVDINGHFRPRMLLMKDLLSDKGWRDIAVFAVAIREENRGLAMRLLLNPKICVTPVYEPGVYFSGVDSSQESALTIASYYGDEEMVKVILAGHHFNCSHYPDALSHYYFALREAYGEEHYPVMTAIMRYLNSMLCHAAKSAECSVAQLVGLVGADFSSFGKEEAEQLSCYVASQLEPIIKALSRIHSSVRDTCDKGRVQKTIDCMNASLERVVIDKACREACFLNFGECASGALMPAEEFQADLAATLQAAQERYGVVSSSAGDKVAASSAGVFAQASEGAVAVEEGAEASAADPESSGMSPE